MRIKKLQKKIRAKNLDLVLIFSLDEIPNTSMIYFADYHGLGLLAITKNKNFLLVPEMEYEKAQKTKLKIYKTDKKKRLLENLSVLLKRHKIAKVGIEENKCSVYLYKKLKKAIKARYVDVSTELSKLRMIKEDMELKYIQKACQITDIVFEKICNKFKFKTEKELKEFIKEFWSKIQWLLF
jgi:Xaa-Pro aminopeptidase/Xaa-Pro dipeptidase